MSGGPVICKRLPAPLTGLYALASVDEWTTTTRLTPPPPRPSRRKRVRFAAATKKTNGPSAATRVLDHLCFAYFDEQRIANTWDLWRLGIFPVPRAVVAETLKRMQLLLRRLNDTGPLDSVPIGMYGGGRGLQLQRVHRPHLGRLASLVMAAGPSLWERPDSSIADSSIASPAAKKQRRGDSAEAAAVAARYKDCKGSEL
jgi:hypothetical protein